VLLGPTLLPESKGQYNTIAHLSSDGRPASIHVHESYIFLSTDKVHPGEPEVVYPTAKKKGKATKAKKNNISDLCCLYVGAFFLYVAVVLLYHSFVMRRVTCIV
jgi:hypothetical protein